MLFQEKVSRLEPWFTMAALQTSRLIEIQSALMRYQTFELVLAIPNDKLGFLRDLSSYICRSSNDSA